MKNKVFLGGTCNNTTWRDELIKLLKIDYFNPVVDNWNESSQRIEKEQKIICDIHFYCITSAMTGVFSIAEVIDSVHDENKVTILQVIPDGFDEFQVKSLQAVVDLVKLRGGLAYIDSDISRSAYVLNPEK